MTTDTTEKTKTTTEASAHAQGAQKRPASTIRSRRPRGARGRKERVRSEFEQMTIEVRRVARVMAGGRRFSFSVTMIIGDKKGRVGVGVGKGADTALAVEKASRDARRHLITVVRTKTGSIPHAVTTKYASSVITMTPSAGRGIVAGSAMRTVLEMAGVTDIVGKILSRSKNKIAISRATVQALATIVGKPASVNVEKSKDEKVEKTDTSEKKDKEEKTKTEAVA
ncbi:SSU ribosomal protein S5p (S2e) [hydrothermal vent metagenome]|uniref:SSU ribosomal protein S5p (S2e) n=1 Tax=hydrothermal vent metagenome TaxID=652676 RepID=A0A3B0UX05_9ZZZZ